MMNTQLDNKNSVWELDEDQLTSESGPDVDIGDNIEKEIQWFKFALPNMGETQIEAQERKIAQREQLEAGILKQKMPNYTINPTQNNKSDMQRFIKSLKQDPNGTINNNKLFRPKVIDKRTGKKKKLGPNDKCPCGSGKKFKKCHGRGVR